ncbi:MAG: BTAD domain-containing putative transcriptional regulator [Thermodesulfobacteriota bacterium]|nr:BTAD domain-containing putative transcriptional regulator [Thermodesulfobacteriota bacterium]
MEQKAYFLPKLNRPSLTNVFTRKQLFGRLDQLRKQPVIWVTGPPGCGKTTLISSYVEDSDIPCLWYQIDEGDADPATFFYYMGLAANTTALQERETLPLLTPEHLQDISKFTPRYFENFYNRLEIPGILVFDNYQELPASSPFHKIFHKGLSKIPEGLTVILISRTYPPQVLVRLLANNQMTLLGWNQLCLTSEESEGIIRLRQQVKVTGETTLYLHGTTGGWAAGLALLLEKAKRGGIDLQLLCKRVPEEIFAYFATEIFEKIDSETQDFLLKTAFLPKMTAKMAEEITSHPQASRIFSKLIRDNCFTDELFLAELTYQYHPLFRDFLLSRAKETFLSEDLAILCRHASKLLEATGQIEDAVALLHDVEDWDAKIMLIIKHAPLISAQGKNRVLEAWLNTLPEEMIEDTPWLLYWKGVCRLPFDPCLSRRYFEQAFERFQSEKDAIGVFLAWAEVIESIVYCFEDFAQLDKWIRILEGITPGLNKFPSEDIEERVVSSLFTALVIRQQQDYDVEEWAKRALLLAKDSSNINSEIQSLANLALYRILMCDFEKADLPIYTLRQLTRSEEARPLVRITGLYVQALHCQIAELHEECLESVSDGLELAQTSDVHIMDCMLLGQAVFSALNSGDSKTAEKYLKKMGSSFDSCKPLETYQYHFLKTRAALIQGNCKQASLHVELALKWANDGGYPLPLGLGYLLKANVAHGLEENQEAAQHLAHAFSIASRAESRFLKYYVFWADARFAFDQGKETSGLKYLEKALGLGRKQGYLNTFIDQPFVTANLCARALDNGIEVGYVQDIILKHNLIPDKPPLHVENWPWALKIFTLGRFALVKDGKPVRFSGKAQEKPLSMLKALIAFGGRDVREDRISDALWPEADGDMMHRCFTTTLHRLRKLIGIHKALELRDGRLTLDPRYCWVDVWAFERILGETDRTWRKGTNTEAVELLQSAIDIYHGNFLSGEIGEPWEIAFYERLRSKFLRGVKNLGHHWESCGEWGKAVECYQRGLEVDTKAEDLYGCLMVCYHHLGRRTEAMSLYDRLKEILSLTLGIKPSPKIEAIRLSLNCQKI